MLRNLQKLQKLVRFRLRPLPQIKPSTRSYSNTPNKPSPRISITPETLMALTNISLSVIYLKGKKIEDFNREVEKAGEASQKALASLLCMLQDQVVAVSQQYQKCLEQQLTIVQESVDGLPSDEIWNELGGIAEDLKVELDNLIIIGNTVSRMVRLEALKFVADNKQSLKLMEKKFKELEVLLNEETKKVQKLQKDLAKAIKDKKL